MNNPDLSMLANPAVVAGLVVILLIEFGLMVTALLDWLKRPAELIRGNRILWLVVLLFVNIVGPVLYLTVARLPKPAEDGAAAQVDRNSAQALDTLYGGTKNER